MRHDPQSPRLSCPVCNVGMNRLPVSGASRNGHFTSREETEDKRLLVEQEKVEMVKKDGDILHPSNSSHSPLLLSGHR